MTQPSLEPVKERILLSMQTALQGIDPSRGSFWNTINSANVVIGDANGLEIASTPFIEILPGKTVYDSEPLKDRTLRHTTARFHVMVTGYLETRSDVRQSMMRFERDMITAVYIDRQLGGLALDTYLVESNPWLSAPTENDKISAGVELVFVAWHRTPINNLESPN
jgi:hypothetical protein